MLSDDHEGQLGLASELAAVAEAAGARLHAETDADKDAAQAAAEALVAAASAAMGAGESLSAIAEAEAHGKDAVRNTLRADTLRSVARTGHRARETRSEHHQAIARAMRLGLSTREIAAAAEVTHGTVRAISNRVATGRAEGPLGDSRGEVELDEDPPEEVHEGEDQSSEHHHEW
jgi:DNA-binding NarL/FixJ family response regulator